MKREWVVAACVVAGAAGLYVGKSAHAQPPQVKCETLYFEFESGKKAGRENVDTQRNVVENIITAKMAAGYVNTIYASSFPIMSDMNKTVQVGQAGILCFATAGN
jgi:hypothetical protein